MAIDLSRAWLKQQRRQPRKTSPSGNPVRQNLITLYNFLARRIDSQFNAKIARKLIRSKSRMLPIGLKRLSAIRNYTPGDEVLCVGATVVNDHRVYDVPKMTIAAMKFTEAARRRIVEAGGECLTFDQLALRNPTGENCKIIDSNNATRKQLKYMGRGAGLPGSTTKAKTNPKVS